jgi:hypothetical protein
VVAQVLSAQALDFYAGNLPKGSVADDHRATCRSATEHHFCSSG